MSIKPGVLPPVPEATARVARAAFPRGALAMRVRDELGPVFADARFAAAFAARGRPGLSPGMLALVTVLQFVEGWTDRAAAQAVRGRIDVKYALGLELDDPGFDHSVLSQFRDRLVHAGLQAAVFEALVAELAGRGLVAAGGKQRTDSTHVIACVRSLNRLELAGEAVRAALEAIAAAHPVWLEQVIDDSWAGRYGPRVDDWRLPKGEKERSALAVDFGRDGFALLDAVYASASPPWLVELPAVQTLRVVLLQNYYRGTDTRGREVIRRREPEPDGDGLPPAPRRIASPYDRDARWAAKGDELFWCGYKLHVSESCDDATAGPTPPPLITNVATTDATVPDVSMTAPIHDALATRHLAPGRHYVDAGYPSARLLVDEQARHGIAIIAPMLADTSRQAREHAGYAREDFTFDFERRVATCPRGKTSATWNPVSKSDGEKIVVSFATADCIRCPALTQCTTARKQRRQLTIPTREVWQAQQTARAKDTDPAWHLDYRRRAGAESTMHQAIAHGARRTRYRGLPKTRLEHHFIAAALNIQRLDAWWTGIRINPTRTSHVDRLHLKPTA